MMMVQLVISETFTQPISLISATVVGLAKKYLLSKKDWRPDFKYSEDIVWIIDFQTIMLMSTLSFPPFVIIQPFLIYIEF